ncbi:Squamosa promoter-binding protein, putative isoform 1 [Hibiscus syriacus]|uniref:Squamosa promoter-binding protein, putative isoform 1 n=1 Tax=Hibiscus syriacus TaxID=106335 RepID=A0A6A3A6T9_HIBSY|nr:Squamosa promoter-binding protein, putative isoform 1 [Hibiscus syriacus]
MPSYKDQAQYWKQNEELCTPFSKCESHKSALSFKIYSLGKWELFKACMAREWLLMKRNSFVHVAKSSQLMVIALITMTIFIRIRMKLDIVHASYYMGSLFYALMRLMTTGIAELEFTVSRLSVFYKQRDFYFYPAWAYSIPAAILKISFSLMDAFLWTALTYYVIGYSPEPERFFRQFFLLFFVHQMAVSLFHLIASAVRDPTLAANSGFITIMAIFLFSGFIIPRPALLPAWVKWGFWLSPLAYAEIAPGSSRAVITRKIFLSKENENSSDTAEEKELLIVGSLKALAQAKAKRMVLPFNPTTISFEDVQYFVDTPKQLRVQGCPQKRLQLLQDITGAFRPGVLTALMGVSGAGKTTLMDEFVTEVLQMIELDEIKDALVGMPCVSGISPEQHARAAAIVMRVVKNTVDTKRTIVCTIHQPSIHIFEAFDEGISGVPKIKENHNPATWMLEVTSPSAEANLGIDFASIYKESYIYKNVSGSGVGYGQGKISTLEPPFRHKSKAAPRIRTTHGYHPIPRAKLASNVRHLAKSNLRSCGHEYTPFSPDLLAFPSSFPNDTVASFVNERTHLVIDSNLSHSDGIKPVEQKQGWILLLFVKRTRTLCVAQLKGKNVVLKVFAAREISKTVLH